MEENVSLVVLGGRPNRFEIEVWPVFGSIW
jgi:hypothetical protein